MELEIPVLTRKQLKQQGICAKCKIRPRHIAKKYITSYCKECTKAIDLERYYNIKAGAVSSTGRTYLDLLFVRYTSKAKQRNIPFELDRTEFDAIIQQPCVYCKEPISYGVDRINSKDSYRIENVVPCCGNCNRAKHTQTAEQYKEWLQAVVDRLVAERLKSGQLEISNLG